MIDLDLPIDIINSLKKIIKEEILKNPSDVLATEFLSIYSADLCSILFLYYPLSDILINKNYLECALLIDGKVYGARGVCDINDYKLANYEDINYIVKSFKHMSYYMLEKIMNSFDSKINMEEKSYVLRKYD